VADTEFGVNMMPSAHDDDQKSTLVAGPAAPAKLDPPLQRLTNSELEILRDITLQQMKDTPTDTALLLLGRVWYRLEQERRRRELDVAELERMYFAR
jgi:hypothetical protein